MSLSSHIAPIYGKIRMIIEDWIRLRKQNDHLKRLPLSNFRGGLFCGIGKEISYFTKILRGYRTVADRKMSQERPAAGVESCRAGFFFME